MSPQTDMAPQGEEEKDDSIMTSSSSSSIQICALQPRLRTSEQTPMEATRHVIDLMERANQKKKEEDSSSTKQSIDVFVLPELCPVGYSEDTFAKYLPDTTEKQQWLKDIDQRMAKAAQTLQAYICYGTIGWYNSNSKNNSNSSNSKNNDKDKTNLLQFTIQQRVLDRSGQQVAVYDKILLCDFGDCAETRFFVSSPSRKLASFSIDEHNFNIGIIVCADQRLPTLARTYAAAKQHHIDVLLQPAAFVRDVSFPTWKSFRETRAVENSIYFVAVNYAGDDYGETTFVKPWVDDTPEFQPQSLSCQEGFLLCDIRRSVLDNIRTNFPFYRIMMKEQEEEEEEETWTK